MVDNVLQGLTGLRAASILLVLVYYSQRMQVRIRRGKRLTGQVQEGSKCTASDCLLPGELCAWHLLLQQ